MAAPERNHAADMAALLGKPTLVQLTSGPVELHPLSLRQFGELLGVLPPALAQFFGTFEGLIAWAEKNQLLTDKGELVLSGRSLQPVFTQLLASAAVLPDLFENISAAMSIAARKDRAWAGALPLDDAIKLGTALWEINADFFVQRVWPLVMSNLTSPTSGRLSIVRKQTPSDSSPAGRESSND